MHIVRTLSPKCDRFVYELQQQHLCQIILLLLNYNFFVDGVPENADKCGSGNIIIRVQMPDGSWHKLNFQELKESVYFSFSFKVLKIVLY